MSTRGRIERTRRALYKTQRAIGDAQALERGPKHYARRVVRRHVVRAIWRLIGK